MRWSQSYIPTLKEAPADAEVISHKLMMRAGMIRKLTSGIYSYLPFGWKTITKVATIVREEMNRAGGQELRLPAVQPADLWVETGRWDYYGAELLRFKDRHNRDCCLGPTHEEVITDLIRGEIRSYRQLPLNLYQIQTKFRDEIRPRFGLMRGREFMMKDAYSFDKDDAGADISYQKMYDTYTRIFTRLGLKFRAVEADSGSIGGSFSHEFMVLSQTGEDVLVTCEHCTYAANQERAIAKQQSAVDTTGAIKTTDATILQNYEEVFTPEQHTVEEITTFLQVPAQKLIKTLLLEVDGKPVAALVRGDRELNEIKLKNHLDAKEVHLATPEQVAQWSNAPVGFAGPVNLAVEMIIADIELQNTEGWVTGANKKDTHLINVSLQRDAKVSAYTDLRMVTQGDSCHLCGNALTTVRGIEVGHVFKLGTKYSESMHASFLDENGKEQLIIMGCYGIGITRIVAASIEQNHDDRGIVFPPAITPYDVLLICLDPKKEQVSSKADALYHELQESHLDVLYDDREERPGVKFNEADLTGIPIQLILGGKGLEKGSIEAKNRKTGETTTLPLDDFTNAFATFMKNVHAGWKV